MAGAFLGNTRGVSLVVVTLDPASVAANTTAEQTFTVPGLRVGDFVEVNVPPPGTAAGQLQLGLGVCGARVSADNTLALRFNNNTAGALDPPAAPYLLAVVRAEGAAAVGGLPAF